MRHLWRWCGNTLWLSLVVLTGWTAGTVARRAMPSPQTATPRQLSNWLAARDVQSLPQTMQEMFLQRLDEQVRDGQLVTAQQVLRRDRVASRYRRNLESLADAWLEDQVRLYESLPEAQRTAFLNHRLAELARWERALRQSLWRRARLSPATAEALDTVMAPLSHQYVLQWIDRWLEGRPAATRSSALAFRDALANRMAQQRAGEP